jgi:hypothetical protein
MCERSGKGERTFGGQRTAVIPEGAEWMDDGVLSRNGVFEGWLSSMGWWDRVDERGKARRFGIDVGKAEKVG